MKICEIFGNTLQGEGPHMGQPATFIRTSGCIKPFCKFCDSKYSWYESKEMYIKEVLQEVKMYPAKLVVISGGEPFIQNDIYELIEELQNNKFIVNIETSGKCEIKNKQNLLNNTLIVCSPKQYKNEFVIHKSVIEYSNYFKFVVGNKKEISNILKFIEDNKIEKYNCFLMPLTTYDETSDKLIRQKVWGYCVKNNIRYSPRIHVDVWGKKRNI